MNFTDSLKEPEKPQSKAWIKNNLRVGDWVRIKDGKKDLMVMSLNRNNKQVQIVLGNGKHRLIKHYSQIECILIDN